MRPPSLDAPQLALTGVTRIRWLAVIGQIIATTAAVWLLHIELPLRPIAIIIAITLTTNLYLVVKTRGDRVEPWLLPGVVLLDVFLLTAILALTGGPANPFCTLYVVHVVLAVVLLGSFWTWVVVALSAAGFALLFVWHVDIEPDGHRLPAWARDAGAWMSLMLIAVLIAYYVGRIHRAFRQRDQQLALMRERTERSARFAAVTALAAGAAHELGSPLGTIAVVAKELEIATAKAGSGEDIVEDARLIRTEVDRCRTILERMRLEVGDDLRYEARVMTAQEFIEGSVADLVEDRKARVKTEVVPGAEQFFLPSRAVLRATGVLLRNAFEASPPRASVLLLLRRTGDDLIVEVEDSGVGMPPEVLKRAGEPFFTTKEMGHGMGMGLFLVKLVIENNDGRLELQSESGKGTLARLVMPMGQMTKSE